MRKPSLRDSLAILIFLLINALVIVLLRPVYNSVSSYLTNQTASAISLVTSRTGLSVSYKSLSPSIFTGLQIKNIVLSDVSDNIPLAQIERLSVHYSLWDFIRGRGLSSIKDFTVDGLDLELDRNGDNTVLEKLLGLRSGSEIDAARDSSETSGEAGAPGDGKGKENENDEGADSVQAGMALASRAEEFLRSLPFNVFVRNIHLTYRDNDTVVSLLFRKLYFDFIKEKKQIALKTNGSVSFENARTAVSSLFSADGIVPESLEGSALTFRLSDIHAGGYSIAHLNVLADYTAKKIDVRTIQNPFPLYLTASYDTETGDAAFDVQTKALRPEQIVSARRGDALMKKIRRTVLTLSARAAYNLLSKKTDYASSGTVVLPETLYAGGCTVQYAVSGDTEKIEVPLLSAQGDKIDATFSGSCVFKGLRTTGALNVNQLVLPNGGVIATEAYIDPGMTGFMAFAPQLMLDDHALTALQLDVQSENDIVYFRFEVSDYEHAEAENPGTVRVEGNLSVAEREIEVNVSSDQLFLDSLAKTGAFFTAARGTSDFGFLKHYLLSSDMYVSAKKNMDSFTCSLPYAFVADTKKDGRFLYLSMDGTKDLLNISRMDFISAGKLTHGEVSAVFSENRELAFSCVVNADSVPYSFSGNYMPGLLTVAGDYGLAFDVHRTGKNGVDGSFSTESFPIAALGTMLTFSSDCGFSYSPEEGLDLRIARFEGMEAGGKYSFHPRVALSGFASKYGLFFENLVYSDRYSSLEGKSSLLWNLNDGIFDSANCSFSLKNPLAAEALSIEAEISNPEHEEFSLDALKKSFYFTSQISCTALGLNRFALEQSENNALSCGIIASGTLDNPYVGVDISSLSLMTAGKSITASASAFVEEKNLSLEKAVLHYNNIEVKDAKAEFDLTTFAGTASAVLDTTVLKKTVHVPLQFTVSDTFVEEGKLFPSQFTASLVAESVSGTFFKKPFPFTLSVLHADGMTLVSTGEEQGVSGVISDDATVNFSVAEGKPVQFNLTGNVGGENINLNFSEVKLELAKLLSMVDVPRIRIYDGTLRAGLDISGLKSDPEFKGSVSISDADFTLPKICNSHITFPKALMVMNHNKLEMPEIRAMVKKDSPLYASMNVFFERWRMERLEAHIRTPEKSYVPGNFEIRLAKFTGDAALDLNLKLEDRYFDVSGDVGVRNLSASVKTKELAVAPPRRNIFIRSSINLSFGQHVTLMVDPLLRAVVVPGTEMGFKFDREEGILELDGDLAFRSGDISYLSRNFYLKNGTMKFNGNAPEFNPLISVQAETRERDDEGNEVRIILSAQNQYFSDFNPKFSSIPARSEADIMTMLGQIAVGDAGGMTGLLLATGDYAIQSTIGRSIENKLRDFLNFDILSFRTNVLQNALNYNFDKTRNNEDSVYGIGNFFDNSTVYFGKYIGRALYVDSLMHWSYDETRLSDDFTVEGLVFRPEIGLELESPFVNIRWNMAPDLGGIRSDSFVYSTSVTLSWKFSF